MAGDREDGKDRGRGPKWYIDFEQEDLDVEALKADVARGRHRPAGPDAGQAARRPAAERSASKTEGPSPWVADFLLKQAASAPSPSGTARRKTRPAPAETARAKPPHETAGMDAEPDQPARAADAPSASETPDGTAQESAGKPRAREDAARPAPLTPPPRAARALGGYRPYALGALTALLLAGVFAVEEQRRPAAGHDEAPGPQSASAETRQDRDVAMAARPADTVPPVQPAAPIGPEKAAMAAEAPAAAAGASLALERPRSAMPTRTTETLPPERPSTPIPVKAATKPIAQPAPAARVPVETVGDAVPRMPASTQRPAFIAETLGPEGIVPTEAAPARSVPVGQPPAEIVARREPDDAIGAAEQPRPESEVARTLQSGRTARIVPAPATTGTIRQPPAPVVAHEPGEAHDAPATATAAAWPEFGGPDGPGGVETDQRDSAVSAARAPARDEEAGSPSSRRAPGRSEPALPRVARTRSLPAPRSRAPSAEAVARPARVNAIRPSRLARAAAPASEPERTPRAMPLEPRPRRMAEKPAGPSRPLAARPRREAPRETAKATPAARIAQAAQPRPVSLPTALQPTPF